VPTLPGGVDTTLRGERPVERRHASGVRDVVFFSSSGGDSCIKGIGV
jgi:hypothetical protein